MGGSRIIGSLGIRALGIPNTIRFQMRRSATPERTGTTANGIWKATLESFRESVASAEPTPAGVSVSAVSATLGVSLLQKVLEIVAKRKSFAGDLGHLASLRQAARNESERLTQYANEDIAAYRAYMEARRLKTADVETARALRDVIEKPLKAARSALACLDLCTEAAGFVHGAVAADLGTAAILLAGAVRAMLLSVDVNRQQLPAIEATRRMQRDRRKGSSAVGFGSAASDHHGWLGLMIMGAPTTPLRRRLVGRGSGKPKPILAL